ncbi:hypothetical protein PL321_18770 [Caloramator sp. mosi_1]|uniref:hypothetical protein n=1 Tax=Caloramator sp. mosi_1 TaxID=3023090 RepID=UPI00235F76F8|nr:hypothetical protein [Caloramator sp. mosi_1]WDC84237.1 hypothetical protein PL321_18770 [Caloramator sp. mosi_1]
MKKTLLSFVLSLFIITNTNTIKTAFADTSQNIDNKQSDVIEITISAAGDCTLGTDPTTRYKLTFMNEFYTQNKDYSYFLEM